MPNEIPQKWKNTKYEETHTHSDEYQKVERVKFLTTRYVECQDKYNTSWEDEERVEEGHSDYLWSVYYPASRNPPNKTLRVVFYTE